MIYVMYKDEPGDIKTVLATSNDPNADKNYPNGVWVDNIPTPASSAGRSPQLKINIKDGTLFYVYVDGAGNSTNDYLTRIKSLEEQMKQLKQAVDDLIMGGTL